MDFSAFMEGIFFFCPEPYFYYDRTWAEFPFLYVPETQIVFQHSLLCSFPGRIVLYDYGHGRFGHGAKKGLIYVEEEQ